MLMRQWMFLVVAMTGLASTSGAQASNVWGKASLGEKASSSSYAPQMLACGKMAMKRYPAEAQSSSVKPSLSKPARAKAAAAFLTRR
jgi:hypothetical protein